jgi:hypothetical protein
MNGGRLFASCWFPSGSRALVKARSTRAVDTLAKVEGVGDEFSILLELPVRSSWRADESTQVTLDEIAESLTPLRQVLGAVEDLFRNGQPPYVRSLTYRNPLEIVVAAGAMSGTLLATLQVLRNWSVEHRRRAAEADLRELDVAHRLLDLNDRLIERRESSRLDPALSAWARRLARTLPTDLARSAGRRRCHLSPALGCRRHQFTSSDGPQRAQVR